MKKLFLALIVAVVASGCATSSVNGRRRAVFMPQVGVVMTVQNNCAPFVSVESLHGVEVRSLAFGDSAIIPISSRAFSGYNREIWIMAKAYTSALVFVGSAMFRASVNIYEGTRDRLWQVDRLDSPPGARCIPPSPP